MLQIVSSKQQVTMSSMEMVEFINLNRGNDSAIVAHSDFLKKVPKVIGEGAGKFSSTYFDAQNKERPCYRFPKREACLMAMSYSYDIQAKVFDRMTELEESSVAMPQVKDIRTQALIENLIRLDAVEQEQARQSSEIARLQETVAVVEARTQPENKHFTVLGYANLVGQKIDIGAASKLGRQCANLSREQGLPIGDVSDPRFGRVHSYHESILRSVVGGV